MTKRDDLDDLRAAMKAATPAPSAERRAAVLAQAHAVHAQLHTVSQARGFWAKLRLPRSGGAWAGLATGMTAIVAVAVLILPDTPEPLPPLPVPTMEDAAPELSALSAPLADEGMESSPAVAEDALPAPEALAAPQVMADSSSAMPASRSAMPTDPWTQVAVALENGALPAPETVNPAALRNALAPVLPATPSRLIAVPWNSALALSDSGDPSDPMRFELVPATGAPQSEPGDSISFVVAAAGFATLLAGEDLGGWGYGDALAMAETIPLQPELERLRDLMRLASAIAAN